MDLVLAFLFGVVGSIVAQPLWFMLSGVALDLFSDLPKVSGSWEATYSELDCQGVRSEMTESVVLRQIGRFVWGSSVRHGDSDTLAYRARIHRNVLVGTYKFKGSRTPAGSGTFQVKVGDDDEEMVGWAVWKDTDTKAIEASEIVFRGVA
ncbi:MAG: hypothetical protein VX528_03705 [Candidatus Latescibacterota bacterium]|nr:hypothetical protein [Candidatus Latescibacterota bacterium]